MISIETVALYAEVFPTLLIASEGTGPTYTSVPGNISGQIVPKTAFLTTLLCPCRFMLHAVIRFAETNSRVSRECVYISWDLYIFCTDILDLKKLLAKCFPEASITPASLILFPFVPD